jgi:LysM repeat protein
MKFLVSTISFFLLANTFANNDRASSKQEYIDKWRNIAIQQMIEYKIPASITLAQAILESGTGTSPLAIKGNNHFGIKCHGWEGDKMYHDDDAKGECFRVYSAADYSFVDHSEFLKNRSRYAELFTYEVTDYQSWAKGLKKAGYATNPKYAEMLIGLIEEFNLSDFDASILPPRSKEDGRSRNKYSRSHAIQIQNEKSKYVVVQKGDTYFRLAEEFGMSMWELRKYNDFGARKDVLEEGDYVYILPKRSRGHDQKYYTVSKGNENLPFVSQKTGVKYKSLSRMNKYLDTETNLKVGTKVRLR